MTAREAAELIDSLPPMKIKNTLYDLFHWQDSKGKAIVHVGWYLRKLKEPKDRTQQEFKSLIKGIGK